jgi:FtsH-binding integral membrane protein
MVVLGVLAATDSLVRAAGSPGRDPQAFYIVPMTDMVIFATLVFFAFRSRSNPAAHKRLILVATIGLSIAALARWPFPVVHRNPIRAALFSYVFLLLLVAYDLWSTHKVHRATLWACVLLISVQQVRPLIGSTATWHAFASRVQSVAR